jgi:hypothetical protein
MPSTRWLLETLKHDFPDINFVASDIFRWSPDDGAIYYANDSDTASLLHEVAHAALGHTEYHYDIELLKMEREAWDFVSTNLAKRYSVEIASEYIENALNTYRDWLHSRSLCPTCEATGIQTEAGRYSCLACSDAWRVNEARVCALRRYKVPRDQAHQK